MRKVLSLVIVILTAMISVSAQTEPALKQYFEGQTVSLKIDMPPAREGVNVYPERARSLNYSEYASQLKRHGASIRRGDEIIISKIAVTDKDIELQLGGAAERQVRAARFNVHFNSIDPRILPPEGVILALNKYVDFSTIEVADEDGSYLEVASYSYPADEFKPGVVQVGPRTTYLKEGFTTDEVVRLLGKPSAISERTENGVAVTVYEFPRSGGRVLIAEFANGMLIRSTMEDRGQIARASR